ncbi:MAG TPA: type I-D CRISPR-associated protein Cas10d/Csc3 [Candidatus Limnocylindrales bacterium]|nr:type I-D CRISPR-associated protein Cas10d/Csc3 [Candidatus Limnocylindrales bacterium]
MDNSSILTVRILQKAIEFENPDNSVFKDFSTDVVPRLFAELAGCTAKGGTWVEQKRQEMLAAGKPMKSERALGDQSITAHLLNGLFPVATLVRKLRQMDTSIARYLDERSYRLFIAGYVLHDWEKFPGVEERIKERFGAGFKPDFLRYREFVEPILKSWIARLGLDNFLKAGGLNPEDQIDTLAYLAHNTQEKYETHHPTIGFKLTISDKVCELTARLTRLADLLSSEVKHPADILTENLCHLIYQLSNGQYQFTFHTISENRGVLTNILNNALLDLYRSAGYQPLLYFPNGVVYLTPPLPPANEGVERRLPPIDTASIPERVIAKIRKLCAHQIEKRLVGLDRDGKGLKFADYYWLFFSPEELVVKIALQGALQKIVGKSASAPKRAEKLREVQSKVTELSHISFDFSDDLRIDRLAEFCDLIERKIWGEFCQKRFSEGSKRLDVARELLQLLNVNDLQEVFNLLKTKSEATRASGGVPLGWYYVAAEYLKRNPGFGPDDFPDLLTDLAQTIAQKISLALQGVKIQDGWRDLRNYVLTTIGIGTGQDEDQERGERSGPEALQGFLNELNRYNGFKRSHARIRPCSLCSSPFEASQQEEAGVLFQPQVYTNKQPLYGSQAIRNICPICSLEMMLRQILMNRTKQSGKDFEERKYRYLYLYPTYYFTAETVTFLRKAYTNFYRTNFRTDIRDHLIPSWETGKVDFSLARFQSLDTFLMSEESVEENNRVFKLDYPNDEPITFFFAAIPPGRDATDTESWVMPAFLTLLFPLLFDVKVVASESAVPIYTSGADFEETVMFDAPHDFVAHLLSRCEQGREEKHLRLRLDEIPAVLSCFTAAYIIHLDANARQSQGGYDANWGRLAELARDLSETPLYVFHYLNNWIRKAQLESPPPNKIRLYGELYKFIDPKEEAMNHPRRLVELYRRFYRAKRASAKANAILKPIDVAADVLLKADKDLFGDAVVDLVAAAVMSLMQRVHSGQAEGKPTFNLVEGKWKLALTPEEERQAVWDFAEYFVKEIFEKSLRGDRARLVGVQLNLFRDTCEFIYRKIEDEERRQRGVEIPEEVEEVEVSASV